MLVLPIGYHCIYSLRFAPKQVRHLSANSHEPGCEKHTAQPDPASTLYDGKCGGESAFYHMIPHHLRRK